MIVNNDNKKMMSIIWIVFIVSFVVQMTKFSIYLHDVDMWADQIDNFINNKPALFDYYLAYGHPGGVFIVLGCFFYFVFGFSYNMSITISVSLLAASATAACAGVSFYLQPKTLWWFTTAFILTMSRFYNTATPPTIVAMPVIVFLILLLCWILNQEKSEFMKYCFIWGVLLGVSAATRLDISLFVGFPLALYLLSWSGPRGIIPVVAGITASFFICDPFMWFMPMQHVFDLFHKFSLHYENFPGRRLLPWYEWGNGFTIAVINILWLIVLLFRRRIGNIVQQQLMIILLVISIIAVLLLISSKYQSIRYLYPILIFWEIILPLYILKEDIDVHNKQKYYSINLDNRTAWVILGYIMPTQVLCFLFAFVPPS